MREKTENGVRNDGLTEEGFLILQTTFMWDARPDTTWKILWSFGYGNDLRLTEEFLHPKCVPL